MPPAERVGPAEERLPVVGRGAADAREAPVVGPLAREPQERRRAAPAREPQLGRTEPPELPEPPDALERVGVPFGSTT